MTSLEDYPTATSDFIEYTSTKKLKKLAEYPFDLTKAGNLSPQRIEKFIAESCGFRCLYATERIDEQVMHTLVELAHEAKALTKMTQMQSGEILNFIEGYPSENRPVLHTATRDFFEQPNQGRRAKEAKGLASAQLDKLKNFLKQVEERKVSDLVMIGIGGSDLGPRATYLALKYLQKADRRVHFISNLDPDEAALVLQPIRLSHCLVVVVSKGGTTLETLTNEALVREQFKLAGLNPENHFVAVTGEGSPMDNPERYLECFYIWDWIGGRFSTTSMVGGVLLSFAFGFDLFWEFLRGANAMDKAALVDDISKNLPLLSALLGIWNHNFLECPTFALIPYSQALGRYPAHIQQVDMESNGKRIDQHGNPVDFQTGPIVWGEPGTNAQHSFYQLLHQGTPVVPIELIGFKSSQCDKDFEFKGTTSQEKLLANLFAQVLAFALGQSNDNPDKVFPGNRPSHLLLAEKLTPFTAGALLAYFEHKIAFQGFIWGINSFDQEGVQLGKILAERILKRIASKKNPSLESQPYPLADALLNQLQKFSSP